MTRARRGSGLPPLFDGPCVSFDNAVFVAAPPWSPQDRGSVLPVRASKQLVQRIVTTRTFRGAALMTWAIPRLRHYACVGVAVLDERTRPFTCIRNECSFAQQSVGRCRFVILTSGSMWSILICQCAHCGATVLSSRIFSHDVLAQCGATSGANVLAQCGGISHAACPGLSGQAA